MQCVNCRFENLPGEPACGRCGSPLRLATAVLDVHPPRAGRWGKRLRRSFVPQHRSAIRLWTWLDRAVQAVGRAFRAGPEVDMPLPRVVTRLVVPGWAHLYCGRTVRGCFFLAVYLALLLPGLFYLGTDLGAILLGLAFSVHAASALSLLGLRRYGFVRRLRAGIRFTLVLAVGLYLPAGWLLTRVADPHVLQVQAGPFQPDDVVLVNRWAYVFSRPRPGDVVFYHSDGTGVFQSTRGPRLVYRRVREGDYIDRVLAGPGAQVAWEGGRLLVDGSPVPWQPLNQYSRPPDFRFTVPTDCYLILPSLIAANLPPAQWEALSCVPAAQIQGRAYLRHQPFERWWRIR
jgi:signal peptidase I